MKLAITSDGTTIESTFQSRFGRTKYFVIYDTETKNFHSINNDQNMSAAQGAGIQSAQCIFNNDVSVVITGNCGPKAFFALKEAGISIYYANVKHVSEAIEKFIAGEILPVSSANQEGHWI